VCLQLLQGIVRPLQSAHQTSAIQRSKSAADVVLRAKHPAMSSNESANHDAADGNQFSFPLSASSKVTSAPLGGNAECGSRGSEKAPTQKMGGLLNSKMELSTDAAPVSNTTDSKVTVDLNENVVTSSRVPHNLPSHNKSGEIANEAAPAPLPVKPADSGTPLSSSADDHNVSSDSVLAKSSTAQTNRCDSGAGNTDLTTSQAGTRSWVLSSTYRQKLGSAAASRYHNVSSRLYGDNFLGNLTKRASRRPTYNTTESSPDTAPLSTDSSEKCHAEKSPTEKTAVEYRTVSAAVLGSDSVLADADVKPTPSSLHFVYSCSTSTSSTVERPSLTSESGDDDNDNDDDRSENTSSESDDKGDEAITKSDMAGLELLPSHSDLAMKEDVARWRQRLVASPQPRRAAHTTRWFDDPNKDVSTTNSSVVQSRSVQSDVTAGLAVSQRSPESSKHVSFDLFTLSLNAALEGELDVLQSLFSQVCLVCTLAFDVITLLVVH